MTAWLRRLAARLRYRRFDTDLREELDAHRAMAEAEWTARGASPDQARARAALALGNVTLAREHARGVWLAPWIESLWQDIRYGFRSLIGAPGFTITALSVLVLALGLNTSFFTAANGLLLRPWRVPDADRMVTAFQERRNARQEVVASGTSVAEFEFMRARAQTVDLAAMRFARATLQTEARSLPIDLRLVSADYFQVLAAPLALGRGFLPGESTPGNPTQVVVISDDVWQQDFGASRSVLGQTLRLQGSTFTIIGVATPLFTDSPTERRPLAWIPLATLPLIEPNNRFSREFLTSPDHCCLMPLAGRLRPGETHASADAELTTLDRQFRTVDDPAVTGMRVAGTAVIDHPRYRQQLLPVFGLIAAAYGLVLLLACANVGNLQLARAMARRREMSIRLSLGAARSRLVRQLLTEGLMLAIAASAIAWLIARILPLFVLNRLDADDFEAFDFSPTGSVLIYMAVLAILTTLLSGLAPALRTTGTLVAGRFDLTDRRTRLRSFLLSLQIAISIVLLSFGALLTRGIVRAASIDPGFAVEETRLVAITLPDDADASSRDAQRARLNRALLDAADARGLQLAGTAMVPLGNAHVATSVRLPEQTEDQNRTVFTHQVSPKYFSVLEIPLKAGKVFGGDPAGRHVMINESLARLLWSDGSAVGRTLESSGRREVVGVVADVRVDQLDSIEPTMYEPSYGFDNVLLRNDPAGVTQLKAIVTSIEPRATFTEEELADNIQEQLRPASVAAALVAAVGGLALLLAAVGTFGVFSYVVGERTREIGVRLALGGTASNVVMALLKQVSWPLLGGLAVGLIASVLLSPVIAGELYGVSPRDPLTYASVTALLLLSAVAATTIPARQALRVDPAITLRAE